MLFYVPNISEGVGCQEEGDGAEGDEEDEAQLRVQMIADIALELFRDTYYYFHFFGRKATAYQVFRGICRCRRLGREGRGGAGQVLGGVEAGHVDYREKDVHCYIQIGEILSRSVPLGRQCQTEPQNGADLADAFSPFPPDWLTPKNCSFSCLRTMVLRYCSLQLTGSSRNSWNMAVGEGKQIA